MAHYRDYHSSRPDRINYSELEQSSLGTKSILLILALIAAAIFAMFIFGDVSNVPLETGAPAGVLESVPAPAPTGDAQ